MKVSKIIQNIFAMLSSQFPTSFYCCCFFIFNILSNDIDDEKKFLFASDFPFLSRRRRRGSEEKFTQESFCNKFSSFSLFLSF
jgi:hypothetical protein